MHALMAAIAMVAIPQPMLVFAQQNSLMNSADLAEFNERLTTLTSPYQKATQSTLSALNKEKQRYQEKKQDGFKNARDSLVAYSYVVAARARFLKEQSKLFQEKYKQTEAYRRNQISEMRHSNAISLGNNDSELIDYKQLDQLANDMISGLKDIDLDYSPLNDVLEHQSTIEKKINGWYSDINITASDPRIIRQMEYDADTIFASELEKQMSSFASSAATVQYLQKATDKLVKLLSLKLQSHQAREQKGEMVDISTTIDAL
mgnify:FL=1